MIPNQYMRIEYCLIWFNLYSIMFQPSATIWHAIYLVFNFRVTVSSKKSEIIYFERRKRESFGIHK